MKKESLTVFLLLMLFIPFSGTELKADNVSYIGNISLNQDVEIPYFENVVFITWDGTNYKWLEELAEDGVLANTQRVIESGYKQTVRITSHKTSTDPGLATLESGYGPGITGIYGNQFGDGSEKLSIPDGYTIAERLKTEFGNEGIENAYFLSWSFHQIDETYLAQYGNNTDPIYENIRIGREADYWMAAENFTFQPYDPETMEAVLMPFDPITGTYASPLIKAEYLGTKAADWISSLSGERFYLRMHLTEPDQAGHGYGESEDGIITQQYRQALVDCDLATGQVLDALENAGVLDKTLVIIGADHGMYDHGHDDTPWPGSRLEVTQTTFAISNKSLMHPVAHVPWHQKDVAPTILASMGVEMNTIAPEFIGDDDTGIPSWYITDSDIPLIQEVYHQINGEPYKLLEPRTKINDVFNISLQMIEWCDVLDAKLVVDDIIFEANSTSSMSIQWTNIDPSIFKSSTKIFHFEIEDTFGNKVEYDIEKVRMTPISFWFSVIGLLVVGVAFSRKRLKK